MRRLTFLCLTTAAIFISLFAADLSPAGYAQDATPAADAAPIGGAIVEILDIGQPAMNPDQILAFVRITFEPGGYFEAHGHPGASIWYIGAGTLDTTILEGAARLTRAPSSGTPAPAEQLAAGDTVTMAEGDALFFDHDVVHTVRNAGDETSVLLVSAIFAADQEPVIFHEGMAAP